MSGSELVASGIKIHFEGVRAVDGVDLHLRPPEILGLPAGVVFLLIGLISMAMGYVLIRRIVDIKV